MIHSTIALLGNDKARVIFMEVVTTVLLSTLPFTFQLRFFLLLTLKGKYQCFIGKLIFNSFMTEQINRLVSIR